MQSNCIKTAQQNIQLDTFTIIFFFFNFRRLPPGPWSFFPFIGVSYKIDSDRPHLTYTKWNRKYGDVVSFTLFGTQRAVVVGSEEAIRDVLIYKQDQFSGIHYEAY